MLLHLQAHSKVVRELLKFIISMNQKAVFLVLDFVTPNFRNKQLDFVK